MIQFLQNLAVFCTKNTPFFANLLAKIFFKIITSVPKSSLQKIVNHRQLLKSWQDIFSALLEPAFFAQDLERRFGRLWVCGV
jgi:hypothetical protein